MSVETVAELAKLTKPVEITRDNIDTLLDRGSVEIHMKSGRWWAIRRNGKTRRWKRDPSRILVPFKYGLKFYGQITENDFLANGCLPTEYYRVKPPPGIS